MAAGTSLQVDPRRQKRVRPSRGETPTGRFEVSRAPRMRISSRRFLAEKAEPA